MKNTTSDNRRDVSLENPTSRVGFSDSDARRFWSFVDRSGACWLWEGAHLGKGAAGSTAYGGFSVARGLPRGKQTPRYAHRVSWELTHGPIPIGLSVLHHCDVPLCVNPSHLFLGTQADNMRDAARKRRLSVSRPRGQTVSDAQVAEIIALRQAGLRLVQIADKYGVSKAFVSLVASGKRRQYSHVLLERKAS